ncbi:MAG: hypothetical protein AAGN66_20230 [Acidobacteriota bacterium]
MSRRQGVVAMKDLGGQDQDRLQRAFGERPAAAPPGRRPVDPERIWSAVRGELPAAEARALVDRMAMDPELAQEWRLAAEVSRQLDEAAELDPESELEPAPAAAPGPRRGRMWMALAASIMSAALGAHLLLGPGGPGVGPGDAGRPGAGDGVSATFRQAEAAAVESLVEGAVPRDAAVLRWRGPEGAVSWDLWVSSGDLSDLAVATGLTVPEYAVPAEALAGLPSGAPVFWRVVARLEDGTEVSSSFESQLE